MNQMESEQIAELTADDIVKLKSEKLSYGCLIALVPALLISGFVLTFYLNPSFNNVVSLIIIGAFILLSVGILWFSFTTVKGKNTLIDQDIFGMRKKIIIAPIQSKRMESSDITTGRDKGGIALKYFMTLRGTEYEMTEHRYLTIREGEFMELHQAPNSEIIVRQRWLKENGEEEESTS